MYGSPDEDCLQARSWFSIDYGPTVVALPHSTVHLPYPEPWVLPGQNRGASSIDDAWVCLGSSSETPSPLGRRLEVVGYRF